MPIYTYDCDGCGHSVEHIQSYAQRHHGPACAACGKATGYAGLNAPTIGGAPYVPGVYDQKGQFHKGYIGVTAPNKRRQVSITKASSLK